MSEAFIAPGMINPSVFGKNDEAVATAIVELGVANRSEEPKKEEDRSPIEETVLEAVSYARNLGID